MKKVDALILNIKKKVKHYYNDLVYVKSNNNKIKENKKVVYLLGTPTYGNLGDHAIAYAQRSFFKEYFKEYIIREIDDLSFYNKVKEIQSCSVENTIIVLIGGGNFGNLYYTAQEQREFVMKHFDKYKLVQFPQSVFFTANREGQKSFNRIAKLISSSSLTLFIREKKSYNIIKEGIKTDNLFLTPDIVTFLNIETPYRKRDGVIFLFRNDIEKSLDASITKRMYEKVRLNNKVVISDTHIGDDDIITDSQRESLLLKFWNELSSKEIIVTDRLHGMIFGYITKTPTIVFDNNNGKISASYNTWFTDIDYIKYVDNSISVDEIVRIIDEFKKEKFDFNRIDYDFEKMANIIRK